MSCLILTLPRASIYGCERGPLQRKLQCRQSLGGIARQQRKLGPNRQFGRERKRRTDSGIPPSIWPSFSSSSPVFSPSKSYSESYVLLIFGFLSGALSRSTSMMGLGVPVGVDGKRRENGSSGRRQREPVQSGGRTAPVRYKGSRRREHCTWLVATVMYIEHNVNNQNEQDGRWTYRASTP